MRRALLWALLLRAAAASPQCDECVAGTFCFQNNLYTCPRYSTSRVSADNITACVCADGFRQFSAANHTCVLCEAGTYCAAELQLPCPENSDSGPGSAGLSACVCLAGYAGAPVDADPCVACLSAQYETAHACVDCPGHSDSPPLSVAETDCKCNAGHTGPDGLACSACAAGTFKTGPGSAACTACGTDAHVLALGSVAADACDCNRGYTLAADSCTACDAGTFKSVSGDGACTECPVNADTVGAGSKLLSDCVCEAGYGYEASATSAACVQCRPGYVSPGGHASCVQCLEGHHAFAAGSSACTECGANTWQSASGQSTCESCPDNAHSPPGSTAQTQCRCDPGFSGQQECAACVAGTFKATDGPAACVGCGIGTTTVAEGTVAAAECITCLAGEYGVVKDGAATCAVCVEPMTLVKPHGSTGECQCNRGFGGAECAACSAGEYKNTVGPEECAACAEGEVSAAAQALCTSCPSNTFESDRLTCKTCPLHSFSAERTHGTCTCSDGYPLLDGSCSACAAGAYESADECVLCRANTFSTRVAAFSPAVCVACPPNSTSAAGANHALACRCVPGYTGESSCRQCAEGTYKTVAGTALCVECAAGTHWPQDKTERSKQLCRACPGNSTSGPAAHGVYNCHCSAGFKRVDDECEQCLRGQHCAGGLNAMQTCPLRSSSAAGSASVAACVCEPGYHGANGTCAVCPVNSYCPGGPSVLACPERSTTQTLTGRKSVAACVCGVGYYEFETTCVVCPVDSYCYADAKTQCASNSTSLQGSDKASDCYCDTRFAMTDGKCVACAPSMLCGGVRITLHMVVLDMLVSDAVSRRRLLTETLFNETAVLVYIAGIARVPLSDVSVFERQSTDLGVKLQVIVSVPDLASAEALMTVDVESSAVPGSSISVEKRQIPVITSYSDAADVQKKFPRVSFTIVPNAPLECAPSAEVQRLDHCECGAGTYCGSPDEAHGCVGTAACHACPKDAYCNSNVKTQCPENETAPVRSNGPRDCRCLSGYYRNNNTGCELCPLHSFCVEEQRHQCPIFDSDLVTDAPGQTERAACHCKPGYFRLDPFDKCQPCPLNFYCPSESEVYACMKYGYTEQAASVYKSNCLCRGGYQWGESDDSCMQCKNHRCGGGVVTGFCSETREPSDDSLSCVCRPGLTYLNIDDCTPCLAGHVKPAKGDESCAACPVGKYSTNTTHCVTCAADMNTTDTGNAHCICDAPLMFIGGRCEPCPPDTYFRAFGENVNTSSVSGLSVVAFDYETMKVGTVTQQWHRGECKRCQTHSSTLGEDGAVSHDACQCNPGFRFVPASHSCEACAANSFESGGVCTPCGIGAISPNTSFSESHCECPEVRCRYGVLHPPKLFGRHCLLACDPVLYACTSCAVGTAKPLVSAVGNTKNCTPCDYGEFQEHTAATECSSCVATRGHLLRGMANRSACLCQPGHSPDPRDRRPDAPCIRCAPGFFKHSLSDSECQPCDYGEFANVSGSLACLSCDTHTLIAGAATTKHQASTTVSNCTCFAGFEQTAQTCVACSTGSYRQTPGTEACILCGSELRPDHYGDVVVSTDLHEHCVACPPNSGQNTSAVSRLARMDGVDDCLCFPHFEYSGSVCVACEEFEVKPGFRQGTCAFCAAGHYVHDESHQCFPCWIATDGPQLGDVQLHQLLAVNEGNESLLWGETQLDCACELGYERLGETCHACQPGSVRGARLPTECEACATGSFQDTRAGLACTACPGSAFTDAIGSDSLQDCLCPAGYSWDTEECQACPTGKVRPNMLKHSQCVHCADGYYQDETGQTACKQCGANEWSELPFNSLASCRCNPGFGLENGACTACALGRYSAGGSSAGQRPECQFCPANKNTSETSQYEISSCQCVSGHGVSAASPEEDPCLPCQTGRYAAGGANTPCIHCGFGGITDPPVAAVDFDACLCNAVIGLYSPDE